MVTLIVMAIIVLGMSTMMVTVMVVVVMMMMMIVTLLFICLKQFLHLGCMLESLQNCFVVVVVVLNTI